MVTPALTGSARRAESRESEPVPGLNSSALDVTVSGFTPGARSGGCPAPACPVSRYQAIASNEQNATGPPPSIATALQSDGVVGPAPILMFLSASVVIRSPLPASDHHSAARLFMFQLCFQIRSEGTSKRGGPVASKWPPSPLKLIVIASPCWRRGGGGGGGFIPPSLLEQKAATDKIYEVISVPETLHLSARLAANLAIGRQSCKFHFRCLHVNTFG